MKTFFVFLLLVLAVAILYGMIFFYPIVFGYAVIGMMACAILFLLWNIAESITRK